MNELLPPPQKVDVTTFNVMPDHALQVVYKLVCPTFHTKHVFLHPTVSTAAV